MTEDQAKVVSALTDLLEKAKSGEVIGFVGSVLFPVGFSTAIYSGLPVTQLLGILDIAKHDVLGELLGTVKPTDERLQ